MTYKNQYRTEMMKSLMKVKMISVTWGGMTVALTLMWMMRKKLSRTLSRTEPNSLEVVRSYRIFNQVHQSNIL